MSPPPPVTDYGSLVDLTGRIHKFLADHPHDKQALDDLHYVATLMRTTAAPAAKEADLAAITGPQTTEAGKAIGAGLQQAMLDLPKGLLGTVLHPLQTAGQITGLGNVGKLLDTLRDPEAGWSEALDATIRATPFNMGYAPERGLLQATGALGDTPASLTEQAHRAGNVASLALLGAKPAPILRVIRGGTSRLLGGLLDRAISSPMAKSAKAAAGPVTGVTAEEATVAPPSNPDVLMAIRDFEAGKISGADLRAAMDFASGRTGTDLQEAQAAIAERATPPMRPSAHTVTKPAAAPPASAAVPDVRIPANSYKELQQLLRSGVPKEQIKVNYWTRGGAAEQTVPPVPVVAGQPVGPVLAFVRGQPYEALSQALANPSTPAQVRTVILQELRRRGIVGSGLLDPMNTPAAGLLAP